MADSHVDIITNRTAERSTGEIVQDIARDIQEMVRGELQLARAELTERAKHLGKAAGVLAAGLGLLICAAGLIIATMTAALAIVIPVWAACLVMAFLLGAVGGAAAIAGRKRLQKTSLAPQRTIHGVKEDVEWIKQRTR